MITKISISELKRDAAGIIRRARENREIIALTINGRVVADIVPAETEEERRARMDDWRNKVDELTRDISAKWPDGVSAVEAVREQRREL